MWNMKLLKLQTTAKATDVIPKAPAPYPICSAPNPAPVGSFPPYSERPQQLNDL